MRHRVFEAEAAVEAGITLEYDEWLAGRIDDLDRAPYECGADAAVLKSRRDASGEKSGELRMPTTSCASIGESNAPATTVPIASKPSRVSARMIGRSVVTLEALHRQQIWGRTSRSVQPAQRRVQVPLTQHFPGPDRPVPADGRKGPRLELRPQALPNSVADTAQRATFR